jgi:hypothetical protein
MTLRLICGGAFPILSENYPEPFFEPSPRHIPFRRRSFAPSEARAAELELTVQDLFRRMMPAEKAAREARERN